MNSDFGVAIHALVYLNHKAGVVSSEELAGNICTNPARVRKVLAPLRRAGLLATQEGNAGGYCFTAEAGRVTLCQVADALGSRFVSFSWHSGDVNRPCLVSSGMGKVMDDLADELDDLCRARLAQMTIEEIDRIIFKGRCADAPAGKAGL